MTAEGKIAGYILSCPKKEARPNGLCDNKTYHGDFGTVEGREGSEARRREDIESEKHLLREEGVVTI